MLNIKGTLIAALLLASAASQAQSVLPLDTVLKRINQENEMLRSYDHLANGLSAKAEGAKAWDAPMLGAGTFMVPYPGQTGVNPTNKGAFMFSVEQEISNPLKRRRQEQYQRSLVAVEQEGRNVAFNDLRTRARKLYYQWLIAEKKLGVLRDDEQILGTLRKLSQIRYQYNKASLSSIYNSEAKLYDVQNMQVMLQNEGRKKMFELNTLMNRPASSFFAVDTNTVVSVNQLIIDDFESFSQTRSDIRRMENNIKALSINLQARKADARPDLRIRFDHMANRDPMMPAQFSAEAMLSIPIAPWSSKSYKSQVKSLEYEIEAIHDEHKAMLLEVQNSVQSMMSDIASMRERIRNYEEKIIPAVRKSFDANRIAYEENRLELPQVLQSLEDLNVTRLKYLDELQTFYMMIADYEREIEQ